MALIEDRTTRKKSAYTRLFGIEQLGDLITKIHGTIISLGAELERDIYKNAPLKIECIDTFLENTKEHGTAGVWIASKKQIKKSKCISESYEPDFLGFDVLNNILYIFEVKEGHQFDTKKASGERKTLHSFSKSVSPKVPFKTRIYISCFDVDTKEQAYKGLKEKFSIDEILTGRDFCSLIGISYDNIMRERTASQRTIDQQKNLEYFVNTLLKIDKIKSMIVKRLMRK